MNSSTLSDELTRRCCRSADNSSRDSRWPDVEHYQSRRILRRSDERAGCDASSPAERGLIFGWQWREFVASIRCTRRKAVRRLNWLWQRNRLRYQAPMRMKDKLSWIIFLRNIFKMKMKLLKFI